MPFTVITLKKVPNSLRGDLTRWMQEIATGVYVGSYNSRVREHLWKRITETVGKGEATLCYSCRNELGYSFSTYDTERQIVDYDGIPLVLIPSENTTEEDTRKKQHGFSDACKYYKANRRVRALDTSTSKKETDGDETSVASTDQDNRKVNDVVFLDIETTGLNADTDHIIEIGAVKKSGEKLIEFHRLIRVNVNIPDVVRCMTGITDEMLSKGSTLEESAREFNDFIQETILVGYNISFDIKFLNRAFEKLSLDSIHNKTIELMHEVKKRNRFQTNYKFETTLKEYGISKEVPHRALEDARLMYKLYNHMGLE